MGESQGQRAADSEVSLALEPSHGAVGSASLHMVGGERDPDSIWVLEKPSASHAPVTAVTVGHSLLISIQSCRLQ